MGRCSKKARRQSRGRNQPGKEGSGKAQPCNPVEPIKGRLGPAGLPVLGRLADALSNTQVLERLLHWERELRTSLPSAWLAFALP